MIAFIAPRFLENTNRYLRAFAALDLELAVISEDPESAMPVRAAAHYRVDNCLDPAQLTVACRAFGKVDRLIGVLEQLQTPMAAARDALGIPGLSGAQCRGFRDKDAMKSVLRAANVPTAKSALASSMGELRAFVETVGYPVIVKPVAGLGTKATYRIENADELAAVQGFPLQVEEFVRAREHTCETVTIKGEPVWRSGTRYFPSPLEVVETPWIQYCVLLPREYDDATWRRFDPINDAALRALFGKGDAVSGTALTHMEWFLREDGEALVNEVGCRPPGVQIMPLMSIAHDVDMFAAWAKLMALDAFAPVARVSAAGSAFFRGQGRGDRVSSVTGVEAAIEQCGNALVELRAPKVGQPRASGYEGEGFAIVKSDTTDGAKQALRALIENIQVRY